MGSRQNSTLKRIFGAMQLEESPLDIQKAPTIIEQLKNAKLSVTNASIFEFKSLENQIKVGL